MPQSSDAPNSGPLHEDKPFPTTGFVRLPQIIGPTGPLPVSRSTFWAGIKAGIYPSPVKIGPRISAWRVEDIRACLDRISQGGR